MHDRARPSLRNPARNALPSVPVPKNRPHGQAGHVGQIRFSDWLKFQILPSDWSVCILTPYTTVISCKIILQAFVSNAEIISVERKKRYYSVNSTLLNSI